MIPLKTLEEEILSRGQSYRQERCYGFAARHYRMFYITVR